VSSSWIPFLLIAILLVAIGWISSRNRRRMIQAEQDRADQIEVGTDVMTTSGLYGTVVARHDDDTVLLSIAPGVEVKWALAALRDVADLPDRYKPGDAEHDDAEAGGSRDEPG
jgi:preprotein translocase subunit YajC